MDGSIKVTLSFQKSVTLILWDDLAKDGPASHRAWCSRPPAWDSCLGSPGEREASSGCEGVVRFCGLVVLGRYSEFGLPFLPVFRGNTGVRLECGERRQLPPCW